MKKVAFIAGTLCLVLCSCSSMKMATNNDDIYASPAEEKLERERIAMERQKAEQAAAQKAADDAAAQKAKDDANPYYKDPQYSKDDYYDYQYASRLNRFSNNAPATGMGYYDNYYTNYYSYNQNPAMYGTSIYTSYNYWNSPSSGFGYSPYGSGMGMGISYGSPSYGYNPYGSGYYDPYSMGYMNGYNNGMYGMGYNPYGYGYNPYGYGYSPYAYNPYGYYGGGYSPYGYGSYGGSGWGYYNSYDVNSGYASAAPTYAPRGSHDGGNSTRVSRAGKDVDNNGNIVAKFMHNEAVAQQNTPRFTEVKRVGPQTAESAGFSGTNGGNTGHIIHYNGTNSGAGSNGSFNNYEPGRPVGPRTGNNPVNNGSQSISTGGNEGSGWSGPRQVQPSRGGVIEQQPEPVKPANNGWQQQPRQFESQPRTFEQPSPQPSYQPSAPRGGGNFGGSRPR